MKKRIFKIIQIGNRTDIPSMCFDIFIILVILANISVTFFQTFEGAAGYTGIIEAVELVTMVIFLVEYILRIWTADCLYPDKSYPAAIFKFAVSFYGVVDLLTILPYFCPFFIPSGAVAFRMLRVVRILHLFRINSRYDAFNVITEVLRDKKNALVSSIFLVLVLMLASSLCMYGLEHEAQPENFSNAFSGIWWSVSTLLTVGYGDIYPITMGGRIMAIVIAFLGVGMVAIPTGIISAGFVEYYTKIKVGTYAQHDADFITLNIVGGHPYAGLPLKELALPEGLYPAVVLRDEDVYTPHGSLILKEGDSLLLGTVSTAKFPCRIEEVCLEAGHSWIGCRIKELDISRRVFVVMVKRGKENICPKGSTLLQEKDVVLLLEKL
ncbi:MAG: ion transporter [Butyrivibrio sp.]|nr:ion transporter [Acetatifactor muris]MCM1561408.1 ion transporter [Butyrivibrio sp.]